MTASEPVSGASPDEHLDTLRSRVQEDPAGLLLDLLVHAPIGLALSTGDLLPQLIERGRRRLDQQISTARMIGSFVVPVVRRKGEAYLQSRLHPAASPAAAPSSGPATTTTGPTGPTGPTGSPDEATTVAPAASGLPIDGYDGLPATAVLPLLDGLDAEERALVAAYERAHRARRTILARIDQLGTSAEH